ncbi:unnamed protein product [Schistosoma turkestanicum]|nr:unnamed protein product [Schistosoma turkestanicum]
MKITIFTALLLIVVVCCNDEEPWETFDENAGGNPMLLIISTDL